MRGDLPVTSATPIVARIKISGRKIAGGDRWGWPSRAPPSLLSEIAYTILSGRGHLVEMLSTAETSNVRITFLSFLLTRLSGGESLVWKG